jgi:tetratricopeptide (TPR) repeat protein
MSMRWSGCAVLLAILVLPLDVDAGAKTWTGKLVLLKGDKEVQIGYTDAKGNPVFEAKLTGISYRVMADKEGWLKVRQNGSEGWFNKEAAVLLEDAVAYFSGRLKTRPGDDQAYGYRAEAWMLKEDFEAALKDLGEAIRLKPSLPTWWSNRAYVLSLTKDYDKALKDCNEAIRLDAKSARSYLVRGNIYRARKEPAQALKEYGEAVRLEPKYVSALYGRANACWDLKNFAAAVKDYDEILKLQAQHEESLNELAWVLATCPDDKVRDGQRAVALATTLNKLSDEKNPEHLDTLAAAQAEAGNFDEAIRREKQALACAPLPREAQEGYAKRLKLYEQKKKHRDE